MNRKKCSPCRSFQLRCRSISGRSFQLRCKTRLLIAVIINYAAKPEKLNLANMNVRFLLGLSIVLMFSYIQSTKAQESIHYGIPYDTVFLKNETKLIYSIKDNSRIIRIINPTVDT